MTTWILTDMEEPVCEESREDDHQQERLPHGITDVFFGFLKIFTKETIYYRLDNSFELSLDIAYNIEQLWRKF